MNPFKSITEWKRNSFDIPKPEDAENRKLAETATLHDLQKPIQQLLCDAHEEAQRGSIVGVNKRMVALLTVTAHEQKLTNFWLIVLTVIIALGTVILICIELCPHDAARKEQNIDKKEQTNQNNTAQPNEKKDATQIPK